MREARGNIWDSGAPVVVITTNGFTKWNGAAVMGRGIAYQAKVRFPGLEFTLGRLLKEKGNHVHLLREAEPMIFSFPVKPESVIFNGSNVVKHMLHRFRVGEEVPGWAAKADLQLIERSAKELVELVNELSDKYPVLKQGPIAVPRPGCGAGELKWEEVKPILERYLDDRFVVFTY